MTRTYLIDDYFYLIPYFMSIRCPYYIDFDVRDVHDGLDSVMSMTPMIALNLDDYDFYNCLDD
jgi:hypothetical protein